MKTNALKTAGKAVMNSTKTVAKATGIFLRKNSPIICITTGTIGMGVAIVLACKATRKSNDIQKACKESLDNLHANKNNISVKGYRQELVRTYGQNTLKWSKLYAPTVLTAVGSAGMIFMGAGILNKRLASVISAAAITENGFAEYRNRVIEKYGKAEDDYFRLGIRNEEIQNPVLDKEGNPVLDKKGNPKVKTTNEFSMDKTVIDGHSHYARYFGKDTAFSTWVNDPTSNLTFLRGREVWLNEKLRMDGYMILNDVYRELGMEPSEAGCTVGWIYDPDNELHPGDNYIDFGLFGEGVKRSQMINAYLNGEIDEIVVDFNPDGVIANKIGHKF